MNKFEEHPQINAYKEAIDKLNSIKTPLPKWVIAPESTWDQLAGRKRNKLIPRLQLFIGRFKRNYKTHKRWASIWTIIRMSWSQSKYKKHGNE